jgi:hypothetical protein
LQLMCIFGSSLGCTSPHITAPCQPLAFTGQMQLLAAFADDSRMYEQGGVHASNAQVRTARCVDVACHTSHVTRQTSDVTRHTSHITHPTSHIPHHTSHITRHTSYFQLAAVALAIKRCAGNARALPLLLLFACAPAGAWP